MRNRKKIGHGKKRELMTRLVEICGRKLERVHLMTPGWTDLTGQILEEAGL